MIVPIRSEDHLAWAKAQMQTHPVLGDIYRRLEDLAEADAELAHGTADELLVELVKHLAQWKGLADHVAPILDAYGRVPKWYA